MEAQDEHLPVSGILMGILFYCGKRLSYYANTYDEQLEAF